MEPIWSDGMLVSRRSERGATAVFVAMVLLLLIGVSAVAVDLAQGWNERRQDQTSVDVAAVAGALSYGNSNTSVADEVMASARTNLDTQYTNAEWNDMWRQATSTCVWEPPNNAFIRAQSSIGLTNCIGLHPDFVWVRLPDQLVDTSFGGVIGFDSLTTRAEATVTLLSDAGGGALPFAIRGNSGSGEVCLDTGPNPEEPCESNESGSFGNIAPPLFGNEALSTSPSCSSQSSANNYVPESIAMGIDHILWEFPQGAWTASGWTPDQNTANSTVRANSDTHLDECEDVGESIARAKDGVPINTVYVDTGNSTKDDVTEGMLTGTGFPDGGDARLTRAQNGNTRVVHGRTVDNNAVWDFLLAASGNHGIPECDGPTIRALATIDLKNDAMRLCLETYDTLLPAPPAKGPLLFSDDILQTPRIGVAPRLWHNNLGSGITFRPIQKFDVIFIHGIWFKQGGSIVPFFPDEGTAPFTAGVMPIEQMTAYLLHDDMVSAAVHTSLGGFSNDTWQPEIWE